MSVFFFLITVNELWKACLISVLFSKMHYQANYCHYFTSYWPQGTKYSIIFIANHFSGSVGVAAHVHHLGRKSAVTPSTD